MTIDIESLKNDLCGKEVLFMGNPYFFHGTLIDITDTHFILKEAYMVFDVGIEPNIHNPIHTYRDKYPVSTEKFWLDRNKFYAYGLAAVSLKSLKEE
ncbi:MAG: hypothetical protein AABY22_36450 [Nanoarchaeota archaeon]